MLNRRELLQAIAALPAIKSIEVAKLDPKDTVIVSAMGRLSQTEMENIQVGLNAVWPNNRIIVLDDGMSIKVVRQDA